MDIKFYLLNKKCPYCNDKALFEINVSTDNQKVLKCDKCGCIFLEKDLKRIREMILICRRNNHE